MPGNINLAGFLPFRWRAVFGLGDASPLFGDLVSPLDFTLKGVSTYLDEIVQTHSLRKR
ncbi:hypothetical protein [Vibrio lentus]|uniref:hypothetical protein n=1 Tax=Vibrio lentus TaxID=136468 RepID=UPI001F52F525|nr:hypothetical protein [Vibrio lentus]